MAKAAPDDSSLAAARKLARPGPWSDTGSTETLLWGKCQGSGKTPYQVSIDLTGPAFRCSCPSRKFPCKHGLALLLLWVEGAGSVADVEQPAGFAQEWAADRTARAASRAAATAAKAEKQPDPEAQAKRLEERLALMSGGMDDFARWLGDLARSGTASAKQQPYAWWDATAARLVDAQLPGLGEQVRAMASEVSSRSDWPEHLLLAIGRWWTATQAWVRRDRLDEAELGDLRSFIGWSYPTEAVRQADAVTDTWTVLGAHRSDDGRIQQQRTWLLGGATGETVQVLDFAAGGQVLPVARVVGSVVHATVARYPGRAVRRALFTDEPAVQPEPSGLPDGTSVEGALATAAAAWARNPWARRVPVVIADARVTVGPARRADARGLEAPGIAGARTVGGVGGVGGGGGAGGVLVDHEGHGLVLTDDTDVWTLLALTGGQPSRLFGELEGERLRPLSVMAEGELVAL